MNLLGAIFGRPRTRPVAAGLGADELQELLRRGQSCDEAGQWSEAESCFLMVLQVVPGQREALFGLGEALRKQGAGEPALACFEQLLASQPDDLPALRQGAQLLAARQQWTTASEWGQRVLDALPDDDKARRFVAVTWRKAGNLPAAEKALRNGLEREPEDAWLLTELGWTLRDSDRYSEAEAAFRRAAASAPEKIEPFLGLTIVLRESDRKIEAAEELKKLLAQHPDNANVMMLLAEQQKEQGDLEAARASYERASVLEPKQVEPCSNLELLLFRMGRFDEALAMGRQALEIDPSCPQAHLNLAIGALTMGLFGEGWRHYQWRFRVQLRRDYPAPPLPGNPLARLPGDMLPFDFSCRRVTLVEDQGLGDELSFLRFAPLLRQRSAHVVYMPDPRIASLVARSGAADRVAAIGEDAPRDTEVFLAPGDLPLVLGMTRAEEIPPPLHMMPLPAHAEALGNRLAALGLTGKQLVGVTWRGGTRHSRKGALFKEAPLAELAKLLRDLPVEVLVLQRNPLPGEIDELGAALGRKAHDFSDLNSDLEWMLALVAGLDEYVAVSNTNLHLRACAGKTARVLVPFPPDYRWMSEGEESPWFPGIRIYRQQVDGDWSKAFTRLGDDLRRQFGGTKATNETGADAAPAACAAVPCSRQHPSPRYRALIDLCRTMHEEGERFLGIPAGETFSGQSLGPQAPRIRRLIRATGAQSLLDYGSGKGRLYQARDIRMPDGSEWPSLNAYWDKVPVRCYDPAYAPFATLPEDTFDGVVCTDVLEHCPAEDLPWIVEGLFGFARKFVFANVASFPARKHLPNGENAHVTLRPLAWWQALFEKAAAAHPGICWEVWVQQVRLDPSGRQIDESRLGNSPGNPGRS